MHLAYRMKGRLSSEGPSMLFIHTPRLYICLVRLQPKYNEAYPAGSYRPKGRVPYGLYTAGINTISSCGLLWTNYGFTCEDSVYQDHQDAGSSEVCISILVISHNYHDMSCRRTLENVQMQLDSAQPASIKSASPCWSKDGPCTRLVHQELVAEDHKDQQGPFESHPRLPLDIVPGDMLSCR
jgi:hypothetical protein